MTETLPDDDLTDIERAEAEMLAWRRVLQNVLRDIVALHERDDLPEEAALIVEATLAGVGRSRVRDWLLDPRVADACWQAHLAQAERIGRGE